MKLTREEARTIVEAAALSCSECGGDGWVMRRRGVYFRKRCVGYRASRLRCPTCKDWWRLTEALGGRRYPEAPQIVSLTPRYEDRADDVPPKRKQHA